jgi:hypothetical protein
MARLAVEARQQFRELLDHFLAKGWGSAALRLERSVTEALARADDPRTRWLPAPRPYPHLADGRLRWVKIHRYWVAYTIEKGEGVVRQVLDETANIPTRFTSGS